MFLFTNMQLKFFMFLFGFVLEYQLRCYYSPLYSGFVSSLRSVPLENVSWTAKLQTLLFLTNYVTAIRYGPCEIATAPDGVLMRSIISRGGHRYRIPCPTEQRSRSGGRITIYSPGFCIFGQLFK